MSDRADFIASPEVVPLPKRKRIRRDEIAGPDPLKGGDVYGWAMKQAALIRSGRSQEIDWINVADEVESVGKSEFRSLSSHLEVVLAHILKWDYQPERRGRSWVNSIKEHRKRVARDLSGSPSLKSRLEEAIGEAYDLARDVAENETGLDAARFPAACPYDWDAIMNRPFVLDQTDRTA